ncbi:hypothetical protein ACLOJK_000846 [Asimina triloba]
MTISLPRAPLTIFPSYSSSEKRQLFRPPAVGGDHLLYLSFSLSKKKLHPSLPLPRVWNSPRFVSGEMEAPASVAATLKLKAIEATPATFEEYGQVVEVSPDGQEFGPSDAQLELHRGTPRFYIMNLQDRKLEFSTITHHASVTQCLGSIGGIEWFLGVAKASILDKDEVCTGTGSKIVQSKCGHCYVPPAPSDVRVFRIVGPKFLKLNVGTWHAGPLFRAKTMDFYNLELSNTNVVDHTHHNFRKEDGVVFVIE